MKPCSTKRWLGRSLQVLYMAIIALPPTLQADDAAEILERLNQLEKQNQYLLNLVTEQQTELDRLKSQLDQVDEQSAQQSEEIAELQDVADELPDLSSRSTEPSRVHISGQAGVIFRAAESRTNFPNEEFRVDEALIALEAQVHEGIYLVTQLELYSRESRNSDVELRELFVEFEDLLDNNTLSVRAGRMQIPFGEEYQYRYVMENPLINHSVSDFWGLDEGLEAYGQVGDVSYIAAIMNGSHDFLRDFDSSKSLVGRISYDPTHRLHLSGSVMRTGTIDVEDESLTELWFGNAFFRSIGSEATTEFHVDLAQLDANYSWGDGYLAAAYGKAWYDDNDPFANNRRTLDFWQIEAQQALVGDSLFAALRYSGMDADKGYPVSGMAARGPYFFGPIKTTELRRLSFGFTYWPYPDLVLKLDYTLENGEHTHGSKRKDTDMLAAEIGARF